MTNDHPTTTTPEHRDQPLVMDHTRRHLVVGLRELPDDDTHSPILSARYPAPDHHISPGQCRLIGWGTVCSDGCGPV